MRTFLNTYLCCCVFLRVASYLPTHCIASYLPTHCIAETLNLLDIFKFKLQYSHHVCIVWLTNNIWRVTQVYVCVWPLSIPNFTYLATIIHVSFQSTRQLKKKVFCKPSCESLPHQYYHTSTEDTPVIGASIIPAPTAARVHRAVSLARKSVSVNDIAGVIQW